MATQEAISIESQDAAQNFRVAGNDITGTEFPDVINGTDGNDTIAALGGDDTIFGSLGSDRIDGGAGSDTLDYSRLGAAITLFPRGGLSNGDPQTSLIENIETIVGALGQPNKIDASSGAGGASLDVNLSTNRLTVRDVPNIGNLNFTVRNFRNVDGSPNADSIIGNAPANVINGFGGNDTIDGRSGRDTLSGTASSVKGVGELDTLTGGLGTDKFIVGDAGGAYYKSQGAADFAQIQDFAGGETIQLGAGDTYDIGLTFNGFQVFVTTGGDRDLIADVSLGLTRTGLPLTPVDSLLANTPKGEFNIAAGQDLGGVFVGA
jgi:Ca2+-binding RTX toxin-like protein